MRLLVTISALSVVMAAAPNADAEEVADATDPERLASIIRDLGYRAKLETDGVGDPIIHSSVGGTDFSILFYGCAEDSHDQCQVLLYKVGYDLTDGASLDLVNEWNATRLVGRAYLDEEDDPWLEMAVNMHAGVSRANFEDTFDWWEVSVDWFEAHIDF